MEVQKTYPNEGVTLSDLIAWAKSVGIHPTLIGSLEESASQPQSVEAHPYLQEAQGYLSRAQECFSQGDRSNGEYWEVLVYEAIQKVSLRMNEEIKI